MDVGETLGLLAPDPRQRAAWPSGLPFGGIRLSGGPARGERAGLAGVTARGLRPFSLGAPRRGTCEAPPIRHGNCRDTFPSGEGFFVACARAGLPYGRPASRDVVRSVMVEGGGDLLRRPAEVTPAPPAMQRGWGHVLVRAARFPGVRGRQPRFRGSRGQCPLGNLHDRVAVRPLRTVTPASAARPPRAVPSRKLQGGPTRVQHDRRRATQSRAGCGHCPPPCHAQPQDSRTRAQLHRSPPTHS